MERRHSLMSFDFIVLRLRGLVESDEFGYAGLLDSFGAASTQFFIADHVAGAILCRTDVQRSGKKPYMIIRPGYHRTCHGERGPYWLRD